MDTIEEHLRLIFSSTTPAAIKFQAARDAEIRRERYTTRRGSTFDREELAVAYEALRDRLDNDLPSVEVRAQSGWPRTAPTPADKAAGERTCDVCDGTGSIATNNLNNEGDPIELACPRCCP